MHIFIANWKMKLTKQEVTAWFNVVDTKLTPQLTILVAPATLHLDLAQKLIDQKNLSLQLCAQDVSEYDMGPYTGEVGAFQIQEFCKYAIINHSERKDTPAKVQQKLNMCQKYNIIPILCFTDERALADFNFPPQLILAWEDAQNISKNGVYAPKDHLTIKAFCASLKQRFPTIPLVYGGSVNQANILALKAIEPLDGVLVGNAALNPVTFNQLLMA